MFSEQQKAELGKPLSSGHVKSRKVAGRSVSYIEGWRVIDEANRIFGFDGWTRETVETRCVAEKPREIGDNKALGFGVSYIAKVKIVVFADDTLVTREGVGAGHGIDRDLGQAHESAIKEAETDAMKRGLMTFGYPFGLALYDKQQEHVADERQNAQKPSAAAESISPKSNLLSEPAATEVVGRLKEEIGGCVTIAELDTFIRSDGFKHRVGSLPDKHRGHVRLTYQARHNELKQRDAA